jgi:hypothetical protein
MMVKFLLATWQVQPPIPATHLAAQPLIAFGASMLAIEVINEDPLFTVLFSATDNLANPRSLECRIGFTNAAPHGSFLHAGGFPLVDASIDYDNGLLRIFCPHFTGAPGAMVYGELLIALNGIDFDASVTPGQALLARYDQVQEAPDPGWPASQLLRKPVTWTPVRSQVRIAQPAPSIQVQMPKTRSPDLSPLSSGTLTLASAWTGSMDWPPMPTISAAPAMQANRADTYGIAAYAFKNMEVLGFHLDLSDVAGGDDLLAKLIAPLNACLISADSPSDPGYRYVVGTRTVLIELLRYGNMALQQALPPLTSSDYQGQHELVVRVLVGKQLLGDDQITDPATFVPTIVVDNPWSKILGRDLQGFDKCMAEFCIREASADVPLLPNGVEVSGNTLRSLREVVHVNLVAQTRNESVSLAPTMAEIRCPPVNDGSWAEFGPVNLEKPPRWRLADFDHERLGGPRFASNAVLQNLTRFLSVQPSPVDVRAVEKGIVGSICDIDNMSVAFPSTSAQIVIHSLASAPAGWQALCELLGILPGQSRAFTFQANNWYRLKFSMSLVTLDDQADFPGGP